MSQFQHELPLPFPELSSDLPLMPARMVNEYAYCPRLAYLEWVQKEWSDSADTVQGRFTHRRVDSGKGNKLPVADELSDEDRLHARSITLSSNHLGLIARMDLIEVADGIVAPVDYKRGKRPHVPRGAYEPEMVQLCVQGLILEDHGYTCEEGVLYFAESRERVTIALDEQLRAKTLSTLNGLRLAAANKRMPAPLEDSPKCPRCSLVGICLPDEVNFLNRARTQPRPLAVAREEALPVYVQAHHAKVSRKGETLEISVKDQKAAKVRLNDASQLVLMGNVYVTTPTLHELLRREIPVSWHSYGGWFLGYTQGLGHKNVELRTAQYQASFDEQICLRLARSWVAAKIANARTLARRNWRPDEKPEQLLQVLKRSVDAARRANSLQSLLGIEGDAAARYFGAFKSLIKQPKEEGVDNFVFDFSTRNRRPPTDPVNALLSYAYALLTRAWTVTLATVGFDPYRGFYHQPRYGRPSLALDMMEPFRPLIADSAVLQAINNGEVRPTDFVSAAGSVNLKNDGRKRFIGVFERRMSQEITHPLFGYKLSYRRLLELQARLLGRTLLGDLSEYPNFTTR